MFAALEGGWLLTLGDAAPVRSGVYRGRSGPVSVPRAIRVHSLLTPQLVVSGDGLDGVGNDW